jgi:hypothetical protein
MALCLLWALSKLPLPKESNKTPQKGGVGQLKPIRDAFACSVEKTENICKNGWGIAFYSVVFEC